MADNRTVYLGALRVAGENGASEGVDAVTATTLAGTSGQATTFGVILPPIGGGKTITGTAGDDALNGTNYADTINGLDGHDTINGLGGNDTLSGGSGYDSISGGDGADQISGGNENDYLNGGAGNDRLDGGTSEDEMYGGAGDDTFVVDEYFDRVYENAGEGTDTILASVTYSLQSFYPWIPSNVENLTLTGTSDINATGDSYANTLIGNSGANIISGLSGNDQISGGDGEDLLIGGSGDDILGGGSGSDQFRFETGDGMDIISDLASGDLVEIFGYGSAQSITQVGANVVVVLSSSDQITFSNSSVASVAAAIQFMGDPLAATEGNDTLIGLSGDDTINGLGGDDTITGGTGEDILSGNDGADMIDGGDGIDFLYSGDVTPAYWPPYGGSPGQPPLLDTGSDVDTLNGGSGNDVIFAGYGDNIDGGEGFDDYLYISFQGALTGVTVDFKLDTQVVGGGTITGIENISWVEGSDFDDYINVQSNSHSGYSDFTTVFGMGGNDTLVAGYYTGVLDGGDGNDIVDGRGSQYLQLVEGGAGDDTLYTNSNTFAVASGGDGNDTIYSHGETHGGNGNDTIVLSFTYYSGLVTGDAGDDTITGTFWADTIQGNDGNDTLDAGDGIDTLDGGAGADVIVGGAGDDSLAGGADNDRFLFQLGDGHDVISDFAVGDVVEFDGYESVQSIAQVGSDVVVVLSSNDQITFSNTDVATVQAGLQFAPPSDDILIGGPDGDVLEGLGGNDTISGEGSNDTLAGGAGSDSVDGGDGDDTLYSGNISAPYSFPYYGLPYTPPQLDVGSEFDTLNGGAGDDTIFAGYGDNVDGGDHGYWGDTLFISFQGATSGVSFDFGLASQEIGGGTIAGFESVAWVEGSEFDDYINVRNSGGSNSVVFGMGGDDTLIAGYLTGVLDGGDGNDIVDGRNSQYLQSVNGGAGDDILYTNTNTFSEANGGDGNDTIYSHATTHGGNGDDTIVLSFSYYPGHVFGDAGNDSITGNYENGVFFGGSGADVIDGGGGGDFMISDDAGQYWWEDNDDRGTDHDVLNGGDGGDVISIGYGDDADGGAESDQLRLSFAGATTGVTLDTSAIVSGQSVTIGGGTIQNFETVARVRGSDFADNLIIANQEVSISVDAGGGDDVVTSAAPVAFIHGGTGNDQLTATTGTNELIGNSGSDTLTGGDGSDTLFAGDFVADPNTVYSDPRFYSPDAGTEHDTLNGGAGNDLLMAGYGDDTDGGTGTDKLRLDLLGATSGVTFDTTAIVAGQAATVGGGTIKNIESVEFLIGSNFADYLTIATQPGDITVVAGDGDDVITINVNVTGEYGVKVFGGSGNDRIVDSAAGLSVNGVKGFYGEDGIDTIDYRNATAGVTVNLWQNSGANGSVLYDFENVDGSAFADLIKGNGFANELRGNGGNDTLEGSEGNDTLSGGLGDDTLTGGEGTDLFVFAAGGGKDTIVDLAVGEKVNISGYTSALSITQVGNNVVLVLSNTDQITFLNTDIATVRVALPFAVSTGPTAGDDVLTGTSGADNLSGLAGNDILSGLAGNDTLDGGAGNDILEGGTGNDTMKGGTGNDIYYVDNVGDKVTEALNGGTDEVRTSVNYTLAARVQVEKLIADGAGTINLTGNELAQTLQGNDAANSLNGGGGIDTLFGGGGADTLIGGVGNDILWGGSGSDRFIFQGTAAQVGKDKIMDFQSGVDKIDLDAYGITMAQVKATVSGSDTILSIDSNRDGAADFTITLVGVGIPEVGDYIF